MLDSIYSTTYKDDVYREDATTENLQAEMAKLSEHEDAIFVLSGTMGNQLALRALLTHPPYSILTDSRSHILHHEAGGVGYLTGATLLPVTPRNGKYLTLQDIEENVVLGDYIQSCPTRVISLENTLHGLIMPLEEVRKISNFARQHSIKMHLDGARLFDVIVAGAGTLPEFTREFDTVTMCFSKGLGAPLGSILVGNKSTIGQARWARQSIGGGMHGAGIITAMAHIAFKDTFGGGIDGKGSLLAQAHANAKQLAEFWVQSGGKLLGPAETCMVFIDIKDARLSRSDLEKMAKEHGLIIKNERLVVHYRKYLCESHNTAC